MNLIAVRNLHEARRAVCTWLRSDQAYDDGHNHRLKDPTTLVIEEPRESAPLLGGLDPFLVFESRLRFAAMNIAAMGDAPAELRKGSTQLTTSVSETGRVHLQRSAEGKLDLMMADSYVDVRGYDLGIWDVLAQYVSAAGELPMGRAWVVSSAFCIQKEHMAFVEEKIGGDPYLHVRRFPAVAEPKRFADDLLAYLSDGPMIGLQDPFVRKVAMPVRRAAEAVGERRFDRAREALARCEAEDWSHACAAWVRLQEAAR